MKVKVLLLRTKKSGREIYGIMVKHDGKRKNIIIGSKNSAEKAKLIAEIISLKHRVNVLESKTII